MKLPEKEMSNWIHAIEAKGGNETKNIFAKFSVTSSTITTESLVALKYDCKKNFKNLEDIQIVFGDQESGIEFIVRKS